MDHHHLAATRGFSVGINSIAKEQFLPGQAALASAILKPLEQTALQNWISHDHDHDQNMYNVHLRVGHVSPTEVD